MTGRERERGRGRERDRERETEREMHCKYLGPDQGAGRAAAGASL